MKKDLTLETKWWDWHPFSDWDCIFLERRGCTVFVSQNDKTVEKSRETPVIMTAKRLNDRSHSRCQYLRKVLTEISYSSSFNLSDIGYPLCDSSCHCHSVNVIEGLRVQSFDRKGSASPIVSCVGRVSVKEFWTTCVQDIMNKRNITYPRTYREVSPECKTLSSKQLKEIKVYECCSKKKYECFSRMFLSKEENLNGIAKRSVLREWSPRDSQSLFCNRIAKYYFVFYKRNYG